MIGYLLICFVDTERVSHDQEIVRQITDLVNHADVIASEYTLLFKNDHFDSIIRHFKKDVFYFLNDPLDIYFNNDEDVDDESDSFGEEDIDEQDDYEYEEGYMPLYIHFVSSVELFKAFCDYANGLDIPNCEEHYCLVYNISCLDQMEILKKLQRPETDRDIMNKIVVSNGDKRERLFRRFNSRHKN